MAGYCICIVATSVLLLARMETIIFKAPKGTKARLRGINPNLSQLLREQAALLIKRRQSGSAYEKTRELCGAASGPKNLSTSKDYLKQYAEKNRH